MATFTFRNMHRPFLLSLLVGCAVGGGGLVAHLAASQAQAPTFNRNVAPILFANCAGCHRPGGIGPMSLLTYEDARGMSAEIRDKVAKREMPPWHADAPRGRFLNDRRLSDADAQTIVRWIDAGTPRGNAADLPPAPKFDNAWTIGTPDVILSMQEEYEVPAQGTVEYQYFEIPTNFTEDKWIQSIEVMPGTREVVHHVLVYAREQGVSRPQVLRQRVDRGLPPVAPRAGGAPAAPRRVLGSLIATTAPGTNAMVFPKGTALRVSAGAVLTFQMHYTAHGMAMKDRSSVGMVFAKEPPELEMRASNFINGRFVIPAGANDHKVDSEISFSEPVHIYALLPHTHLRGKRWEYRLVRPDSQVEPTLSVPRYDFNWQTYYQFAQPLAIPVGARIEASAWYDNSAANGSNPNPNVEVRWGDQTWEEMQYTGFLYTVDSQRRTGGGAEERREKREEKREKSRE